MTTHIYLESLDDGAVIDCEINAPPALLPVGKCG